VIAPVPFTALLSEYFRKIVPGIKKNGIGKFRKNISELITAIIWIGEGDNGHMYETLGIAGFVTVCRHKSQCGAERFM